MAIDNLPLLELALEVCDHEVPPAHEHTTTCGNGRERAQRSWTHRRTERLIVIYAVCLSATLYAKADFLAPLLLRF
eukprot:4614262-Pleurochrysis_carterae.AAC.1